MALAFAALRVGGTASSLGVVLAAGTLPQLVFALAGGVFGDRWDRVRLMVGSNVVAASAQGLSAVLLLSGVAAVWHLALLAVVVGGASAFFQPAAGGDTGPAVGPVGGCRGDRGVVERVDSPRVGRQASRLWPSRQVGWAFDDSAGSLSRGIGVGEA